MKIGIRREDKSVWEARIPIVPEHIAELRDAGVRVKVQPSAQRVFTEEELRLAGAEVSEDLSDCGVILGVKEIPIDRLEPGKVYVFFAHVIKGQPYNMPMLRRLMELRSSLIDYERIVDAEGRRLVSFSRFAGMAGLIDSLWAYGQRLVLDGEPTPLSDLHQALHYPSLDAARAHLESVARRHREAGGPPVVIALTGMGRVSRGALEVARCLEPNLISPAHLSEPPGPGFHLVLLDVPDLVVRRDGGFVDPLEYRTHPDRYESAFPAYMPYIDLLLNGIYWEPQYPRLITKKTIESSWRPGEKPRLRVIGDVSCDIEGSVEITVRACDPGSPTFVWDVDRGEAVPGLAGRGPVVMATDILPTELPREASFAFSEALVDIIPALAAADPMASLEAWRLPPELSRAVILHQGELTPEYRYLEAHLSAR